MVGNKDKQILIRASDYEIQQAKYFAAECGISVAELFRVSLRMIANNLQPSKIPQFERLYNKEE
ncbi:MAG: hypothetical protein K2H13_08965 [Eubacterium sp.]|nr:hypothetical protein [Eubacterium sp.]